MELGQIDGQNALVVVGLDAVFINAVQIEAALYVAAAALAVDVVLLFFL